MDLPLMQRILFIGLLAFDGLKKQPFVGLERLELFQNKNQPFSQVELSHLVFDLVFQPVEP